MSIDAEKIKKNWMVAVIALVVLALVIGAVLVRRGNERDAGYVVNALGQLEAVDTLSVRSELTINLPERLRSQQRPLTNIAVVVDGDVDKSGETVELTGRIEVEAKGPGNVFFSKGEIELLNDGVLFKLSDFPALLNPSGSLSNRWTGVDAELLAVNNIEEFNQALMEAATSVSYQDTQDVDGVKLSHFVGALNEEQEKRLQDVTAFDVSGSKALDVLSRLLEANNVSNLEIWVNTKNGQLVRVAADFVRPLANGENFDFASLSMNFSGYGKAVTIERPEKELTVKPTVFAKLFGTGDIQSITPE